MDRSSTPRASQQQQRQQGSSSGSSSNNNTHYGNIGIGPRRGKNRSRSGSEELSQIIAEAQRAKNEQKMHSNGFWPISNGFSRPTSVTPTPYNLNGDAHENRNAEEEQSRTTSPGLLSWVRNAIMLGPSGRAAIPFDENNDPISQRNRFSPTDPIKRNQTPLLPGTIPSFHHIDRQRTLEPPLVIQERPRSERSSISFDGGSSVGHDSLESYDFAASVRRSSTISSVSTASSAIASSHRRSATDATVNDTEDDDSDQEDVYAPFAQRQHGPSLIRPTARREALGFGPPSPPTSVPQNEFQNRTSSTALGHGYGITGSEHNLNISEAAQESGQTYVTDTEEARTIPSVIVSTASPQLTSQELESNTPISGWVEANHSESATPKPAERVVQSTESAHRLAEISAGKQAGSDLTEIVHDIDSLNVAKKPRRHVHGKGHRTFEESSIDTAFTGDGEDLNDTLGRPKSPEELIRLRQSRERVVLGSQGANTRAGQAAPIRRARAASMAKEFHQKNVSSPSRTEDIAPSEKRPVTTLQRSASSSKALLDSRSARDDSVDNVPASSPHKGRKEASEELKSPKSGMRMRRPLGFLSKRRDISESSADSTHSHSRSASLNVVDSLSDLKKENVPFWRLGIGRDKRNVSSQETNKNKDPEKDVKGSKEGELREVAANTEQESIPSLGRKSAQKGAHLCLSDDKAHKSYRLGALKGEVKPRRIRVRHRNKPTKEREFSNLYLVQELHLGGRAAANANAGSSPSASPLLKPQKALASTSQTSLTGSDSGQNVANGKRKATWVMKFSLDGKYLAVAGQDAVIRVFGVLDSPIARSSAMQLTKDVNSSEPLPGSPRTRDTDLSVSEEFNMSKNKTESEAEVDHTKDWSHEVDSGLVFTPDPIKEFKGHTSDILDLSWSKGGFLLSASMDKTARVWHLSWPNNLVAFVHGDFVTSAVFHPRDDRFFLSGSLDGKLRLWNISTKKVQASQEVPGLITACAFTHSGNTACVGTFSGAALFYQTDGLVFTSSVAVRSASGKHQKGGRKITAIEPILTEEAFYAISNLDGKEEQQSSLHNTSERVLITSNDSRVRAFDIGSKSMIVRYKAKTYTNRSSQIRATLTDDNAFILAGSEATSSSEGGQVHIWSSAANLFDISQKGLLSKLASGGMNAVAAANQKTTSLLRSGSRKSNNEKPKPRPSTSKEERKVQKQKDRSDVILDDTVEYFTAHAGTVTCAIIAPALSNGHLRKANDPLLSMSEEKIQQRLAGNSTGDNEGLAQLGRTISAAMTSPLRIASGGPQSFSTATSPTSSSAIAQSIGLSNKVNRIIVTVDDQAIVRVWRNDSLAVLVPSNGKGK